MKDITNQRFGSLVAIEPSHQDVRNQWYWVYKCNCGNSHIARANTVTYRATKKNDPELPSCGCVELRRKTIHGLRKVKQTHPIYKAHQSMLNRCYSETHKQYPSYGAKGVTICDEWRLDFMKFYQWSIDNGWREGLVIDKDMLSEKLGIQPHVYSPNTCQWIEPELNSSFANERKQVITHSGHKLNVQDAKDVFDLFRQGELIAEIARKYNVAYSTIHRIIHGDNRTKRK